MSLAEQLPDYSRYTDVPPCYDPDQAMKDFNALTPEQKGKLSSGIAVATSTDDADKEFEKASSAAAAAVQTIDTLFITLTAKFKSIDDAQTFLEEFSAIQEVFRGIVTDSHSLAITISQYSDSFDAIIIKFCADKNLTVEQRIAKIKDFIDKADSIKGDAGKMEERFTQLKDRFGKFVGTFSSWAKEREEEDEQKIKDLYAEIKDLDDQIAAIETAMTAVSTTLAATLPITGILAAAFPIAAPWIIGAGCAIAGVEIASVVGLAVAKNMLLDDKRVKENQIKDLQDEISNIKATRTQLEKDGQVALYDFITNIFVIQNVWTKVVNDAGDIHHWLQDGADDAKYPTYMKIALEKAVKFYSKMAKYLEDYADGVTSLVESFED